jgi:hypothetical protein
LVGDRRRHLDQELRDRLPALVIAFDLAHAVPPHVFGLRLARAPLGARPGAPPRASRSTSARVPEDPVRTEVSVSSAIWGIAGVAPRGSRSASVRTPGSRYAGRPLPRTRPAPGSGHPPGSSPRPLRGAYRRPASRTPRSGGDSHRRSLLSPGFPRLVAYPRRLLEQQLSPDLRIHSRASRQGRLERQEDLLPLNTTFLRQHMTSNDELSDLNLCVRSRTGTRNSA